MNSGHLIELLAKDPRFAWLLFVIVGYVCAYFLSLDRKTHPKAHRLIQNSPTIKLTSTKGFWIFMSAALFLYALDKTNLAPVRIVASSLLGIVLGVFQAKHQNRKAREQREQTQDESPQ